MEPKHQVNSMKDQDDWMVVDDKTKDSTVEVENLSLERLKLENRQWALKINEKMLRLTLENQSKEFVKELIEKVYAQSKSKPTPFEFKEMLMEATKKMDSKTLFELKWFMSNMELFKPMKPFILTTYASYMHLSELKMFVQEYSDFKNDDKLNSFVVKNEFNIRALFSKYIPNAGL